MTDDQQVEETTTTPAGLRPFNQWLLEQRGGSLHGELTETLAEVVAAAVKHEKAGSLTVKINVKPEEGGIVIVTDEVKAKVPEARGAALFHTDKRGNLSRENPNQIAMPLREVPRAGAAESGAKP